MTFSLLEKQSNHVSDKGLIYKVHLRTQTTHIKKKTKKSNPIEKKMNKGQNRHFSREDIEMAYGNMTVCSISLIIMEIHI